MKNEFMKIAASGLVAISIAAGATTAQTPKTNKDTKMSTNFKLQPLKLEQYTLENGLRVVLNQDNAAPVVTVAVYYDVGSRNEREGRTGFAHLFEHMMFQGSENVKKAEHFQFVSNAGGTMNGTTNTERTNYFEALPANQLPLGLWLESDRMRSLAVTKENLDNQRNAVQEEKRLGENQPFGQVFDQLMPMIYKNYANSHSVIGSMEDLNAATVEDVKEFFRIYYAPNNAVLVISGARTSASFSSLRPSAIQPDTERLARESSPKSRRMSNFTASKFSARADSAMASPFSPVSNTPSKTVTRLSISV
jgi:predicted Zn-dependent peptidase